MIQSINGLSNTTNTFDKLQEENKKKTAESNELAAALTGVAETEDVSESNTKSTTKPPVMDVIEISPEGRAAVAAQKAQSTENQTLAQSNQTLTNTKAVAKTTSEGSAEDSSAVDLSGLTEEQINKLVDEGKITQADANIELAKREAQKVAEDAANEAVQEATASPLETSNKNSSDDLSKTGLVAAAVQE
ncbi:hypothetical protein [Anaerotignum sp.]|uniref:hypothetical protein n=1 Tax=Anaerotignum sp. TaxID=2039241 RepID=UPI002714C9D8|nr:hypothetical protein [Anaerotignum sp.]